MILEERREDMRNDAPNMIPIATKDMTPASRRAVQFDTIDSVIYTSLQWFRARKDDLYALSQTRTKVRTIL